MNQEEGKNEILVFSIKVPFLCCGQILSSNYRLTHSASELLGFTCTSSLTMSFNNTQGLADCCSENFGFIVSEQVQVNPYNSKAKCVNFLNESMTLKWNFQRGGGFKLKNLPWEGYGYFLEQHILRTDHSSTNYAYLLNLILLNYRLPQRASVSQSAQLPNIHKKQLLLHFLALV